MKLLLPSYVNYERLSQVRHCTCAVNWSSLPLSAHHPSFRPRCHSSAILRVFRLAINVSRTQNQRTSPEVAGYRPGNPRTDRFPPGRRCSTSASNTAGPASTQIKTVCLTACEQAQYSVSIFHYDCLYSCSWLCVVVTLDAQSQIDMGQTSC